MHVPAPFSGAFPAKVTNGSSAGSSSGSGGAASLPAVSHHVYAFQHSSRFRDSVRSTGGKAAAHGRPGPAAPGAGPDARARESGSRRIDLDGGHYPGALQGPSAGLG